LISSTKTNTYSSSTSPLGFQFSPEGWEPDAPFLVKMLEEEYEKNWVVHRLDKFTAHRALNIQFEKYETEKVYRAITVGAPTLKVEIKSSSKHV
jgi:23S rRNA-/tRNA-specific pseudouridylate synthase